MSKGQERSWFWRHIGFWFVPINSEKLGTEELVRVSRATRNASLKVRRLATVLSTPFLIFGIIVSVHVGTRDPSLGFITSVLLLIVFGMILRAFRVGLTQISLSDRSFMHYGKKFESLDTARREEVFQRQFRETAFGSLRLDEVEAEQRLKAQGTAYRILGPALLVFTILFWTVCLSGWFEKVPNRSVVTAVLLTWLAALILAAPVLVQVCSQPDDSEDFSARED